MTQLDGAPVMSRPSLFTMPRSTPLIAPSILSADFATLQDECLAVLDRGANLLHLDVMDGHFVPNLSMGPALCRSLRKHLPKTFFDVHMMVREPALFIDLFAKAGADNYTVHIECCDDPESMAAAIHDAGMSAGLAINPDTDFDDLAPFVDAFDLLLVMSVRPGFSGQAFIPKVLETTRRLASMIRRDQHIEMDGGVSPATAPACLEAGSDVLVSASAIFQSDDYGAVIAALRGG